MIVYVPAAAPERKSNKMQSPLQVVKRFLEPAKPFARVHTWKLYTPMNIDKEISRFRGKLHPACALGYREMPDR